MSDDRSYVAYCRYAAMVGSPALDYESWARLRHKLDKGETAALRLREKWLANETDIVGPTVESSRTSGGAAQANLPGSPAPLPK